MQRFGFAVVLCSLFIGGSTGCSSEKSEHDKMVKQVQEALKKEGIQSGVEPVIELTKQGENSWVGTAKYGEIVYDLRVFKDSSGQLMLERRMREPSK